MRALHGAVRGACLRAAAWPASHGADACCATGSTTSSVTTSTTSTRSVIGSIVPAAGALTRGVAGRYARRHRSQALSRRKETRMHVGMASVFQNPKKGRTDREVYRNELRLADLAEPLGYESVWGVEHHFTDYTMCPDVLQFLTYVAGRTQKAQLGSMVVVLPWHDPMRVAEELSMLDNNSDGRLILGSGRGAGTGGWTFCDGNPERAREMARRYIGGYYQTVLDHYHFERDHLAKTKGYEYYGKMSEKIAEYGTDTVIDYFVNLQVSGTPEQCYEKILDIHRRTGNSHYVGVFSYAGMPYEEAESNMRLFAKEVMPQLKRLEVKAPAAPEAAVATAGKDVRALGF